MNFWGKLGLGVAFTIGAGCLGYVATKNIKEGSAGLVDWATNVATNGLSGLGTGGNAQQLAAPISNAVETLADGSSRVFDEVEGGTIETIFHPNGIV